jgi:hypothetical protein
MGSLVLSLALFVPFLFASMFLIRKYREKVMTFVSRLKVVQALKASKFYRMYDSLSDWRTR